MVKIGVRRSEFGVRDPGPAAPARRHPPLRTPNCDLRTAVSDLRSPIRSRLGLSLVEVLIAVAIASGGLTMLVAAANKCLSVVKKARVYDDCRVLFAEVERQHPLQLDELEEDSESGTFEGEFSQYSWQRDVTLFTEEEDDGVYEVRTRILWDSKNQARYEEFITLIHLPSAKRMGFIDEEAVER